MMGYATHGDTVTLTELSRCEHDLKNSGSTLSILTEHFIEVAKPEEENGVLIFALYVKILAPKWSCLSLLCCGRLVPPESHARPSVELALAYHWPFPDHL